MFYRLRLRSEAYHEPSAQWHTYTTTHGLRAVSRKHAIKKGLAVVNGWPGVQDRSNHPDWKVTVSAEIEEEPHGTQPTDAT